MLSDNINTIRYSSALVLYNLTNALVNVNNMYFKRGVKRYVEEIATFQYQPSDFTQQYMAVIEAVTIHDIRNATFEMLKNMVEFYDNMKREFTKKPAPTYENLAGTYEELWCNYRNKVIVSTEHNDPSYAFHVAMGAQEFFDEMTESIGTKKLELMKYFDVNDLSVFKEKFLHIMDEYLTEYRKVGRTVEQYTSFEQLYEHFMQS